MIWGGKGERRGSGGREGHGQGYCIKCWCYDSGREGREKRERRERESGTGRDQWDWDRDIA